jgi:hypothetical protein
MIPAVIIISLPLNSEETMLTLELGIAISDGMLDLMLSGRDFNETNQLRRIRFPPRTIIAQSISLLISNFFKNLGFAVAKSLSLICSLNLLAIFDPK